MGITLRVRPAVTRRLYSYRWPSALKASWNVTRPRGICPPKDSAKNTSGGTPSSTKPGIFVNPNFR